MFGDFTFDGVPGGGVFDLARRYDGLAFVGAVGVSHLFGGDPVAVAEAETRAFR